MIDGVTLTTYLLVLLGFVFLPGPATLMTLARALGSGPRAGVATGLGIAVGDLGHTLLAIIGVSAIIAASATLFTLLKYAGAAYLIYLGVTAILDRSEIAAPTATPTASARAAFRQGALAELLNPKSALFFLAFLPQFVRPENGPVSLQLLILGVLFVLMGLLSTVTVALAAGHLGAALRQRPSVLRWTGRAAGAVYCGLGLRLALQER